VKPDPAVSGQSVEVSMTGTPDIDISGGTATLKVKYLGLTVLNEDFDICSDLGASCPLKAGQAISSTINHA
jgi:hypothetical protein